MITCRVPTYFAWSSQTSAGEAHHRRKVDVLRRPRAYSSSPLPRSKAPLPSSAEVPSLAAHPLFVKGAVTHTRAPLPSAAYAPPSSVFSAGVQPRRRLVAC